MMQPIDGLKSLLQHKNKRPEHVGAFDPWPVSVFSHNPTKPFFNDLQTSMEPCRSITGAGNETRTRDPDLGKVVLYQLSYSRVVMAAIVAIYKTTSTP